MVDYYEELGLDRSLGLDDLNRQLSKAESLWKSRRTRVPEKATRMLALIIEAREAFANSASRSEYDRALDVSKNNVSGSDDSSSNWEAFSVWRQKAADLNEQQVYDLALLALNRALASLKGRDADVDFYLLASEIFLNGGDPASAMRYANEALLMAPDSYEPHYKKAMVYKALAEMGGEGNETEQFYSCLLKGAEVARLAGDNGGQGKMLGVYAYVLYHHFPDEKQQAEVYAIQAVGLGDEWGNGQKVLDEIKQRAEKEKAIRLDEAYNSALEKTGCDDPDALEELANDFESMEGFKDSKERAADCRRKASKIRQRKEELRIKREQEEEENRIKDEKRKRYFIKAAIWGAAALMCIGIITSIWNKAIQPAISYSNASRLVKEGRPAEGAQKFKELGEYSDAQSQAIIAQFAYVDQLLDEKKTSDAISLYTSLNNVADDDADVSKKKEETAGKMYAEASALYDSEEDLLAIATFKALGDYSDSKERVDASVESAYEKAVSLCREGHHEEAAQIFEKLGGYSQSNEYIKYISAMEDYEAGEYDWAYTSLVRLAGFEDSDEQAKTIKERHPLVGVKISDVVKFGSYEQDNNEGNGKEPIEWIVLGKNGDFYLLISKLCLDGHDLNEGGGKYEWGDSELHGFLVNDFYNTAFNDSERACIVTPSKTGVTSVNKKFFENVKDDCVTLLDVDEVKEYFVSNDERIAQPTGYAAARMNPNRIKDGYCFWFLRPSNSNSYTYVPCVDTRGGSTRYSAGKDLGMGVRPVIWLDSKK